MYERRNVEEARRDLSAWLKKWGTKYAKLCVWVEENIEETWSFYSLPVQHHKHMKSTNMLERLNQEFRTPDMTGREMSRLGPVNGKMQAQVRSRETGGGVVEQPA